MTASPGCFIVALKETDEMLGTMLLTRRNPDSPGHLAHRGNELELTYVFRQKAWGHGYAIEAAWALLRAAPRSYQINPY